MHKSTSLVERDWGSRTYHIWFNIRVKIPEIYQELTTPSDFVPTFRIPSRGHKMMIWVEKKNFKNFHRSFLAISKKLFFCLFKICEPVIMYNSPNFQPILDFSRPQLISTDLFKVYFSKFFCQSSHYWWPKITQPPKTSEIPKNCVLKI